MKIYNRLIIILIILIFPIKYLKSQSIYQTWPTVDVQGKIFNDLEVKIEYRNKYDNSLKKSMQGRIDLGIAYKFDKLKLGVYYREIYNIKNDKRVSEIRPHLDLTYKLNSNIKFRLRNEFRIKEQSDNILRYRLRYSYALKLFKNYNPFVQNEIFISEKQLVRNRVNIGLNIKFYKTPFTLKPSYIFESNRKVSGEFISWSQKNIFVFALSIKI